MTIAVLFARNDSIYKTIEGCDVWDKNRNALNWDGCSPVVAHPPCRAWGNLRQFSHPRPGEKELAIWAIEKIRKYGGVLEHPRSSTLWIEAELPYPQSRDRWGGWTLPIFQHWWGHKAEKATFLYIVGCSPFDIPNLPMRLDEPTHTVSSSGRRRDGTRLKARPELTKREREETPVDLAIWLIELAKRCKPPNA